MKNVLCFIFLFSITMSGCPLFACECSSDSPEFVRSTNIFIGEVVNTETKIRESAPPIEKVTFKVLKAYRGSSGAIVLTRDGWFSDCDVLFDKGEKYLVFARTEKGELVTNVCDGTKKLSAAAGDIKKLNGL